MSVSGQLPPITIETEPVTIAPPADEVETDRDTAKRIAHSAISVGCAAANFGAKEALKSADIQSGGPIVDIATRTLEPSVQKSADDIIDGRCVLSENIAARSLHDRDCGACRLM